MPPYVSSQEAFVSGPWGWGRGAMRLVSEEAPSVPQALTHCAQGAGRCRLRGREGEQAERAERQFSVQRAGVPRGARDEGWA